MIWMMKKDQLAKRLAKESHVSTAVAADQVDRIVSDLLVRLRKGQPVSLPGLGTFQRGSRTEFQFDPGHTKDKTQSGSKKEPK